MKRNPCQLNANFQSNEGGPAGRTFLLYSAVLFVFACGGGGGGGTTPPIVNPPQTTTSTVSGKATYALVPQNGNSNSLDYAAEIDVPIRGAEVEILDSANAVLGSQVTTTTGDYSFVVNQNTAVRVRVKARLFASGSPSYDFQVIDNTSAGALYAIESQSVTAQGATLTLNVAADSGWGGTEYTTTRAAGPFAILDSVYQAREAVLQVASNTVFPPLKINWSVDNRPTDGDEAIGEIGTSFYRNDAAGTNSEIFLLGAADIDTDEYDQHIVAHEWTHYIEDRFGRSDSIGGGHSGGDRLDPRVAFSEGLGYSFAAMILGDPNTIDTLGDDQASGFNIDVENNTVMNPGWYSEGSAQSIIYDLFDATDDGTDNVTLGFAPLYAAVTGNVANGVSFATLHTFVDVMKQAHSADASNIDAIAQSQSMVSVGSDRYGSNETNNAGDSNDVLPIYSQLPLNGGPITLCSIGGDGVGQFGTYNKLSNRRFLRFSVGTASNLTITANGPSGSDPDMNLFQGEVIFRADGVTSGEESFPFNYAPGDYVLELYEYSNITDTPRGRTCFAVSVTVT